MRCNDEETSLARRLGRLPSSRTSTPTPRSPSALASIPIRSRSSSSLFHVKHNASPVCRDVWNQTHYVRITQTEVNQTQTGNLLEKRSETRASDGTGTVTGIGVSIDVGNVAAAGSGLVH